jgi:hypothetical protein
MRILGRTLGHVEGENGYVLKIGDKPIFSMWKNDTDPYYEVISVSDDYTVDCMYYPRHYGTGPRIQDRVDNVHMNDFYGFCLFDEEIQYAPTQEGDREDDI